MARSVPTEQNRNFAIDFEVCYRQTSLFGGGELAGSRGIQPRTLCPTFAILITL